MCRADHCDRPRNGHLGAVSKAALPLALFLVAPSYGQSDAEPSFGSQTIADKTYIRGQVIPAETLPAATGGGRRVDLQHLARAAGRHRLRCGDTHAIGHPDLGTAGDSLHLHGDGQRHVQPGLGVAHIFRDGECAPTETHHHRGGNGSERVGRPEACGRDCEAQQRRDVRHHRQVQCKRHPRSWAPTTISSHWAPVAQSPSLPGKPAQRQCLGPFATSTWRATRRSPCALRP